jgi:hypothetical protein
LKHDKNIIVQQMNIVETTICMYVHLDRNHQLTGR